VKVLKKAKKGNKETITAAKAGSGRGNNDGNIRVGNYVEKKIFFT